MKNSSLLRLRASFVRPALAALLLLPALASASSFRPEDGFGVGFVVGTPSGFSASLPMNDGTRAVNGLLGYRLGGGSALQLQADYVWIRGDLFEVDPGKLALYFGPGAYTVLASDPAAGVRFVVGLDYRFEDMPLQVFLEAGPGINVLPNTSASGSGGLGIRYYF